MNDNKIHNLKEVKNKLQNFQEGKDYTVSPTGSGKWFCNFFSDELKRFWGDDRILVNRVVETDSNKDYDYYGEFENYQDGSYRSFRMWSGKNYQDSESYRRSMKNSPFFHRDPEAIGESLEHGRIGGKKEATRIGLHSPSFLEELKGKHDQLTYKLNSLLSRPESDFGVNGKEKKEFEIEEVKNDIVAIEREIKKESHRPDWISCPVCDKTFNKNAEVWGVQGSSGFQSTCCHGCAENFKSKKGGRIIKSGSDEYFRKDVQQRGRMGRNEKGSFITDNNSDLEKENFELRQQLSQLQAELVKVQAELKKLTGKGDKKLEQQQTENERVISRGSAVEIKDQVQKSQALVQELSTDLKNTAMEKKPSQNGSLPYLVVGSLLVAGVGGVVFCWKKRSSKK